MIATGDFAFFPAREAEQSLAISLFSSKFNEILPAVRGDDGALDLQIDGACCAKRAMRNAAGGCES